jgi:hypothetical protein
MYNINCGICKGKEGFRKLTLNQESNKMEQGLL